jgi:hypothetical protein
MCAYPWYLFRDNRFLLDEVERGRMLDIGVPAIKGMALVAKAG